MNWEKGWELKLFSWFLFYVFCYLLMLFFFVIFFGFVVMLIFVLLGVFCLVVDCGFGGVSVLELCIDLLFNVELLIFFLVGIGFVLLFGLVSVLCFYFILCFGECVVVDLCKNVFNYLFSFSLVFYVLMWIGEVLFCLIMDMILI